MAGVPRRDRQPKDVRERPAVVRGNPASKRQDGWREDLLGRDDSPDRSQGPGVLGGWHPLEHETVHILAGKTHLDPHAREGDVGQGLGDGVLEGPIQVGERDVDHHSRHRVDRCRRQGGAPGPARRTDARDTREGQLFAVRSHAGISPPRTVSASPDR
jgi:hypothetical protein